MKLYPFLHYAASAENGEQAMPARRAAITGRYGPPVKAGGRLNTHLFSDISGTKVKTLYFL
jgi:hypothetical protein